MAMPALSRYFVLGAAAVGLGWILFRVEPNLAKFVYLNWVGRGRESSPTRAASWPG